MRILVTGATGFLGHYVVKELLDQGHVVFGTTHLYKANDIENLFYIPINFNDATSTDAWMLVLEQIDVVINCVGIFNQSRNNKFINVHTKAPVALFEAASACHVKKIVQVSALGVNSPSATPYQTTKLAADQHLMAMDIDWTIFRPSWMVGFEGAGTLFFSALANLPVIGLPYQGSVLMQPVVVKDVAKAIAYCATATNTNMGRKIFEVGGPEEMSFREIMLSLRAYYGITNERSFTPPFSLLRLATQLAKNLAPNSFLGTALPQLAHDNLARDNKIWDLAGIKPQLFNGLLTLNPVTSSLKLRVKSYFLLPVLRLILASFWLLTGIGGLFYNTDYNVLPPLLDNIQLFNDFPNFFSTAYLYLSLFVGLALLFNYQAKKIRYLSCALVVVLITVNTLANPLSWLSPNTSLIKNLVLIVAGLLVSI